MAELWAVARSWVASQSYLDISPFPASVSSALPMRLGFSLALASAPVACAQAATSTPLPIPTPNTAILPKSTPPPGGWWPTPVTPELISLLYTSLANVTLYRSDVSVRVCVTQVSLVESQVVAGTNYRFTTNACDVPSTLQMRSSNQQQPTPAKVASYLGQCKPRFARGCVEADAVVVVDKSWDTSVQVWSVDARVKPVPPGGVRAAEV